MRSSRRTFVKTAVAASCLTAAPRWTRAAGDGDTVTVTPKVSTKPVVNPGKGWSAHDWPKWQAQEVLDFVGMGVRRFDWAKLEPREGEYDWSPVEETLAAWGDLGRVCNLGVMCANSHSQLPGGLVTPQWVFDAGAKRHEMDLTPAMATQGTAGHKIAPVFDDPVFLAKLRAFLQAFAQRFDGDPRLAVLDIRSYGNWGECHMHPFKVPDIAPEKFREHVQMHLDAFKKTQLCLSRNSHLGKFGPLKEVFDWAVLEKHLAPRRDGICGNSDGKETALGLGIAPGVFELYADYDTLKRLGWWAGTKDQHGQGFRLEDCIENGHPTWVDLGGGKPGLRLLQENRALVERLTNRIGYHFVLKEAKYPKTLPSGAARTLSLTWENQGVATLFIPAKVSFALLSPDGKVAAVCEASASKPADWKPGTPVTVIDTLAFKHAASGNYTLAIGLLQPKDDLKPSIKLGNDLPAVTGWFELGPVRVV
ncbi:MAG: DUF4832 domain-containing protein [Proteobacteria bacterium]|nr:DUF4832 domain-containing protein [Pseudomonadota bacterium]